jgi:hypothetical protein
VLVEPDQQQIGRGPREAQQVGHHDHRSALGTPPPHLLPEVQVAAPVEALVGLVEQQHVRLAQPGHHQVELLPGAAGEMAGNPGPGRAGPVEGCGRRSSTISRLGTGIVVARSHQDEVLVGREEVDTPPSCGQ